MSNYRNTPSPEIQKPDLIPNQLATLRAIEEYDMWFVAERLARKKLLPPHRIETSIKEFKKYMALIALGHTGISMISSEVDEVWHNFILFTYEYGKFCDDVIGEFVHHAPRTTRHQVHRRSRRRFIVAYRSVFGPVPHIWFDWRDAKESLKGESHDETTIDERATQFDDLSAGDCDSGCSYIRDDTPTWLFQADCDGAGNEPALPPEFCRGDSRSEDSDKREKGTKREPIPVDYAKDQPEEPAPVN